jgi:hypothetical protein
MKPGRHQCPPSFRLRVRAIGLFQRFDQTPTANRIIQQVLQHLLVGQGVEQELVVQRRFEEPLALPVGQRARGIPAQQFFRIQS